MPNDWKTQKDDLLQETKYIDISIQFISYIRK